MRLKYIFTIIILIGLFVGSASAGAITACGVISGSGYYYQTNDISATGTCIDIRASNVDFNGNGYNITYGTTTGATSGITNGFAKTGSNITLRNTKVYGGYGASAAILLWAASGGNITNNTVNINTNINDGGIYVYAGTNNFNISGNIVNTSVAFSSLGASSNSYNNIFQDNIVNSDGVGIYTHNGTYNNIFKNNTINSSSYGLYAVNSGLNSIMGGSIISRTSQDYYINNATDIINNTNFTAIRTINFASAVGYFNYSNNNAVTKLRTNLSSSNIIYREISNWNQTNITFTDRLNTGTATAYYVVNGLSNKYYDVYTNTTLKDKYLSDNNGYIPFNVSLTANTQTINVRPSINYTLQSLTPTNGSTEVSSAAVTFTWREWGTDIPYTLYVSKDNEYLNIVSTSTTSVGTYENFTSTIYGLTNNTKYWWKVKNNSGYYSSSMNFTTSATPTTNGRLNLTVFDETNYSFRINNFTADIYDTNGTKITKNSTNGWCNLSSSEINSGIYLVKVTNSSYRDRSVLFTSPANVTMYLPNTTNNIDLAVFVLNDYTGQFPWSTTILKVYNNNSLMYSSYFSADAKIPVYLIDASTYAIHIESGTNTRIWGNYVPYTSQEVGILVSTVDTDTKDFSYNISNSITGITLSWSGVSNIRYVNYTIYKGDSRAVEYTLNTSLDTGETNYIKSGSTDIYYVVFNSSTIHSGFFATKKIFEDRTVKERYPGTIFSGNSSAWKYDTFILPDSWAYAAATGLLILLAVSFDVYFGWFGALITVIFANMFYYWKWLPQLTYTNADGTPGLDYGQGLLILFFIISVWLMRKDSGD